MGEGEDTSAAPEHFYRVNGRDNVLDGPPTTLPELQAYRQEIEPWVTSLIGTEHLALLVGSGLSTAVGSMIDASPVLMGRVPLDLTYGDGVERRAAAAAEVTGRGAPNVEDQLRAALELIAGLQVMGEDEQAGIWQARVDEILQTIAAGVLKLEADLVSGLRSQSPKAQAALTVMASFFGSFLARAATKDRLHIFTTNYDRMVEYALDESSTWQLDRFVGTVAPRFRASRLALDVHYSPPGIRGEPRYLEGVARLTKLHGSIDWLSQGAEVVRASVPFGCREELYKGIVGSADALLIYPNPAKDVETSEYPYAELFRDFSAAVVRPETVLVTYGYGFGDDHINRVIADMLRIPSTHLLVISYGDPDGRIRSFVEGTARRSRISMLLGSHFGNLENLVHWYLPKPALDRVSARESELLMRRGYLPKPAAKVIEEQDEAPAADDGASDDDGD